MNPISVNEETCIVKRIMKRHLALLAIALGTLAAAQPLANAQDIKPVVTVSVTSYDAIVKDAAYVGKVVGVEGLDKTIEGAVTKFAGGLDGLDKSKPMGFVLTTDGLSFSGMGFV